MAPVKEKLFPISLGLSNAVTNRVYQQIQRRISNSKLELKLQEYLHGKRVLTQQWLKRARIIIRYSSAVILAFSVILFGVILWDDHELDKHKGTAIGTVRSASNTQAVVSFYTAVGINELTDQPSIWFPSHLYVGQTVLLEYNKENPQHARIVGRGARYAIIPLVTLVGRYWLCAFIALRILQSIEKVPGAVFSICTSEKCVCVEE